MTNMHWHILWRAFQGVELDTPRIFWCMHPLGMIFPSLQFQKKIVSPRGWDVPSLKLTASLPLKIGWLEYYVPIGMAYFQVLLLLVSGKLNTLTCSPVPCKCDHQVEKTWGGIPTLTFSLVTDIPTKKYWRHPGCQAFTLPNSGPVWVFKKQLTKHLLPQKKTWNVNGCK